MKELNSAEVQGVNGGKSLWESIKEYFARPLP